MRFWESKSLAEMTPMEWESVCDRCGKCCLVKLEDEDTGEIALTKVACKLINLQTCLCSRYDERCSLVAECIDLKQHDFTEYRWLPSTCAYRLLANGRPLPDWHPLVSGSYESVKAAKQSISHYAVLEAAIVDPEDHIIEWLG